MALGQRIRQCRQELGLSQRQLCGDRITRNMLSQIENGSAKPSMDTLQYLAGQLGKPVSYFLEEDAQISPNQAEMRIARARFEEGDYAAVRQALQQYKGPDALFDCERWLLEAMSAIALAQTAIKEKRYPYALSLLEEAARCGSRTPYYTEDLERRRILLLSKIRPEAAAGLPELSQELTALAQAVLPEDPERAGRLLDAARERSGHWRYLRGKAYLALGAYSQAAEQLHMAEGEIPEAIPLLEQCYIAMEDYKMAYAYACKQKSL